MQVTALFISLVSPKKVEGNEDDNDDDNNDERRPPRVKSVANQCIRIQRIQFSLLLILTPNAVSFPADAVDDSPNKTKRENFLFNQSVKDKLQNWRKSGCEKVGGISILKKLTEFVKICKSDESAGVAGPAAGTGGVLESIEG